MTDADLARWEADAQSPRTWMMDVRVARALIAEVRRLRAENAALRDGPHRGMAWSAAHTYHSSHRTGCPFCMANLERITTT